MTIEEIKRANVLIATIEHTEQEIEKYRKAKTIEVGIPGTQRTATFWLSTSIAMTAAEIGDCVVAVLERRVAAMRAELKNLGIEG